MNGDETRESLTSGGKAKWANIAETIHDAIGGKIAANKRDHLADVLETFEGDLAPLIAPVLQEVMQHPDFPEALKPLLSEIAEPQHFTASLGLGIAIGAVVGPALSAVFAPFLNDIADVAWSKTPTMELSPEQAAMGEIKGVLTKTQARDEAITSGYDHTRYDWLAEIAGNAPGIDAALMLWRWGKITDTELDEVIRYSNLNPKFYDMIPKLQYSPPTASSVIMGAVQNHLGDAEARKKYQEAGADPDNYEWQYEGAGRPPGTEQMLELLNRELMTETEVRQGIRESDIKNKYIDNIIQSRVYLPPPRSIVPMLRHGAIDETKARQLLKQRGLVPEDVDAFIAEAHYSRTTEGKALTQAQVTRMYSERFITRADAQTRLTALKLPADEVTLLLNFADDQRREVFLRSALTKTRTLYVGHKIVKATADSALGELGIGGADRTELFAVWDVERETNAPHLTTAQWQGALRRGLVNGAQFDAAMTRFGHTAEEADILAALAFPPPKAPTAAKTKDLTAAQLVKLWEGGKIQLPELLTRLQGLGYSAAEANEIANLENRDLTTAQQVKLWQQNLITRGELQTRLLNMGYSAQEANEIVSLAKPPEAEA